jgi:hypothetical protein
LSTTLTNHQLAAMSPSTFLLLLLLLLPSPHHWWHLN